MAVELGCEHGRSHHSHCPWCLGINDSEVIVDELAKETDKVPPDLFHVPQDAKDKFNKAILDERRRRKNVRKRKRRK